MSDSPESVVRSFLATGSDPKAEHFATFFDADAVWVDGPQGVRRGGNAIVEELTSQLSVGRDYFVEVDTLLADGPTVMVEWHGGFTISRKPIACSVMTVFEVNEEGRITHWRESYDLKSVTDQIEAAGFGVSE
jgi:limonene-1,2-epoxide hydrolase